MAGTMKIRLSAICNYGVATEMTETNRTSYVGKYIMESMTHITFPYKNNTPVKHGVDYVTTN